MAWAEPIVDWKKWNQPNGASECCLPSTWASWERRMNEQLGGLMGKERKRMEQITQPKNGSSKKLMKLIEFEWSGVELICGMAHQGAPAPRQVNSINLCFVGPLCAIKNKEKIEVERFSLRDSATKLFPQSGNESGLFPSPNQAPSTLFSFLFMKRRRRVA